MAYRPTFRKQGDGSRCQWFNCGCASAAMAAQRHRRGVDPGTSGPWPPMPGPIRNFITSVCRGTTLNEADAAINSLYRADLWVRYAIPWASFQSLIISGRGASVSIKYSVIAPTKFDGSPGFVGNHAVYVNERRASDGAFLVYDPLADGRRTGIPKGPQWWPATLLKKATGAYPGCGYGYVTAGYTRDTEV